MSLKEYVEKIGKVDPSNLKNLNDVLEPLQEMFKVLVQEALKAEMSHHLGYEKHARSSSLNARNGSFKKNLKTSIGAVEVDIPRDRRGEFEPKLVQKGETIHEQLGDKIISMYAKGMTLRDINSHLQEIYGLEISPSQLSDITDSVLPVITEWQSRSLDSVYPVVYLDAIHFKGRFEGKVTLKAVYLCLGIKVDGNKDILGLWIGESESATFWLTVCNELKNRGVEDIFIACIDGLSGFSEAINTVFPKTEIQLCVVHQVRNSMKYVASKHQKDFLQNLKMVYQAPDENTAYANLEKLDCEWGIKYPLAVKPWKEKWDKISTYFKYPTEVRKVIYTTNPLEGLNRQIRKVTKAKALFPTDQSIKKIVFLACRDIMKKWSMPVQNWAVCISQFSIYFEGRLHVNNIVL